MQFQQMQQQIQMIAQQRYQVELQITELEKTLEELDRVKDDAEIYKSVGTLLVRNDDKASLKSELEEKKETLGIRVKTLKNQETALREMHQKLQGELTQALQQQEGA